MIRFSGDMCRRKGALVECLPGIKTDQLEKKMEGMGEGRNEKVVLIHEGTNNVKSSKCDDHVVGQIWDLCTVA